MEGGGIALVVRHFFLPVTGLALLMSIAWRGIEDRRLRTTLQIVGTILFFAPQVAVFCLWDQSILLVLHQEAVVALWVLAIAVVMWWRALFLWRGGEVRLPGRRRIRSPIVMSIVAVAFTGFALLTGRSFLLDTFAPRRAVDGPVERLWIASGPRHVAIHRYIVVHEERFEVTADIFTLLRRGDRIRGEVGVGSHTVVALDEIRTP